MASSAVNPPEAISDSEVNGHEDETSEEAQLYPEKWIKHPLKNAWVLWYYKNDRNREWVDNNKVVETVSFAEDFWSLYHGIVKANKLNAGCDYSLFKEGIQPMWEDPANKSGGRWLINIHKNQRQTDLETAWLEMLLCLIGEAFDDHGFGEEVCGAVVNIRTKGDKLALWTRDYNNQEANVHIGRTLRDRLNMPKNYTFGYQAHMDTSTKTGSTVKTRYQV
ncbi:hypothetical protein ACOMHN_061130 [Nucella lapillus]